MTDTTPPLLPLTLQDVVFEVGGKKYGVKYSKDAAKKGFTLSFEGELPEDLKQTFRSVP